MCQRYGRMDPFQAILFKRQGTKKRRCSGKRMDSGTDIVKETGQCQFFRTYSTTGSILCLKNDYRAPGLGQSNSGGEAIRPRPNNYSIIGSLLHKTFFLKDQAEASSLAKALASSGKTCRKSARRVMRKIST